MHLRRRGRGNAPPRDDVSAALDSASVLPIALLLLAGTILYVALSLAQPIPGVFPDEFIYQHLARSTAAGDGFAWRGADVPLRAALYVYVISPAWWLASGVDAYQIAKVATAAMSCLTSVAVWSLARRLLPSSLALITAGLSLIGTWMVASSSLLTENLALPLAACALVATVMSLYNPGSRIAAIAIGFAVVASWARLQVVVLVPAILFAHLIDVALAGKAWRERARQHRLAIAGSAALILIGAVVVLVSDASLFGNYSQVVNYRPSIGRIAGKTGLQLIEFTAMTGFLPVLLAVALSTERRAWRDPVVGPLLAVFWPVTLLFALESGAFLAGVSGVQWGIERYMSFAMPLALVLFVVALAGLGRARARDAAGRRRRPERRRRG